MKLSKAATYFDRSEVLDGYSGAPIGFGQLDLFDDSKRDALGADRRTLSAKPGMALPEHRCVALQGRRYVVGDSHPDEFNGATIREKYILQDAPFALAIGTAAEHLAGTALGNVYAGGTWVKDLKLETFSSDLRDMYAFYTAKPLPIDTFILLEGSYYRVRSTYHPTGGFRAAEANQLYPNCFGPITFLPRSGAYDPVSDGFAPATGQEVPAFVMHFHDDYEVINSTLASWKSGYEPGDVRIRVLLPSAPKAEDTFERTGKVWSVISAYQTSDGSWSVHGRPQ